MLRRLAVLGLPAIVDRLHSSLIEPVHGRIQPVHLRLRARLVLRHVPLRLLLLLMLSGRAHERNHAGQCVGGGLLIDLTLFLHRVVVLRLRIDAELGVASSNLAAPANTWRA